MRTAFFLLIAIDADRADEALIIVKRARELNPNDVGNLRVHGMTEQRLGDFQASLEPLQLALRIARRDPLQFLTHASLAAAHLGLKDYATALEHTSLGLGNAPGVVMLQMYAAIANAGLGNLQAARNAFDTARQLAPEHLARWLEEGMPTRDAEVRQRMRMLLRIAAGLEDPGTAVALL